MTPSEKDQLIEKQLQSDEMPKDLKIGDRIICLKPESLDHVPPHLPVLEDEVFTILKLYIEWAECDKGLVLPLSWVDGTRFMKFINC